ncbi:MAG: SGNH/GDSL hydrolase family protein [Deltaproteobacteria bacterium]|nr:MAG: SGNH/GDSL hydrolase family protein [Deltaproteobacteria bacterium]
MNASTSSGALHDAALNWLRRSFPAIIGVCQLSIGVQIRLFIGQGRRRSHLRRRGPDDYIVPVPAELLYVALGDSTAIGIGAGSGGGYPERIVAKLRPAFPTLKLLNLGQSGATSSDLLESQLPRALGTRPRLVTLGIGINDVGLQIPDDAFALNLEETVVPLRKLGAPIAIANIPDLALAPAVARVVPRSLYERRIELFNDHITATAARHRLSLVDLYAWSREALPGRPKLFSPDGFHPSARGYDVWAERMLPAVLALLRQSAPLFL